MKKIFTLIVALMTTMFSANAEEIVLFEGSEALSWDGIVMDVSGITATSDLTLHVTIETTSGDWWQFKFAQTSTDWSGIPLVGDNEFVNASNVSYPWSADTYTYEFELTDDQIDKFKKGVAVQGSISNEGKADPAPQLLLKKVTIESKIFYKDPVDITSAMDESGNIESKNFNGFSDDAVVEFTWNSSNTSEAIGWGAGSLASIDGSVSFGNIFSIRNEGENKLKKTIAELKDALNAGPDASGRYGLYWNIWETGGATSERVSVMVYEVEGFDGEGYLSPDSQPDPDAPAWEEDGKTILSAESDPENFGIYTLIPASEFDGYTLGAKVIFTFEVEGAHGYVGWGIGRYGSSNLVVENNEVTKGSKAGDFSVGKEGANTVETTLADLKEALTTGPDDYGHYGLLVSTWNFGSGACKVTNVNVEIKELIDKDGQEVFKAPEDVQTMIGINTVSASNGIMYNLAGQRVSDMKGIVVKDGKKFVIK